MPGAVAERAQQTNSTCFGRKSKKVQTVEVARTGKQASVETQTRHWRDVPYAERRDLVTKMYGTVSTDRVIKTAENVGAVHQRGFDMPDAETVVAPGSRQY